jgi:hypothetical protein
MGHRVLVDSNITLTYTITFVSVRAECVDKPQTGTWEAPLPC